MADSKCPVCGRKGVKDECPRCGWSVEEEDFLDIMGETDFEEIEDCDLRNVDYGE